jgi:hypothetical protein
MPTKLYIITFAINFPGMLVSIDVNYTCYFHWEKMKLMHPFIYCYRRAAQSKVNFLMCCSSPTNGNANVVIVTSYGQKGFFFLFCQRPIMLAIAPFSDMGNFPISWKTIFIFEKYV